MKKNIIIINIIFLFLLLSCENNGETNVITDDNFVNKSAPKIEFVNKICNFGTLIQGEIIEHNFVYKNIGGKELKILSVKADCGCTVPKFDKKGIKSGQTAKIKVIYNSDGFYNNQYKTIKVKTNCDTVAIDLIITAFIKTN